MESKQQLKMGEFSERYTLFFFSLDICIVFVFGVTFSLVLRCGFFYLTFLRFNRGFPGSSNGKESACSAGD